jgi:NAD(P)-dependent dehydrogenase (short-subunit alcohol dehydrogenase family)
MAIALVTGTSTGIGLATAITLGRAGHTVYAGMRNLERASDLKAVIAKEQLPVAGVQLDVDDDGSVSSAIQQVLAERGQIDVLVNNAGIGGGGPVEEVAIDVFRRIMETNFFGGLRCIKAVVPGMRERRSGCIINVTSVAGRLGASPQGPYAASKWAFEGLSEVLAAELKPFGIRVAIVEPGIIATPMTMTPRPMPPPGPYTPHRQRMVALFTAALKTPASPFTVAETICDIVRGKSGQLRYPAGPDGAALLQWRQAKTDEEWVNLGAATDADFAADLKKNLGLDVSL